MSINLTENELFAGAAWAEVLRLAYGMEVHCSAAGLPYTELNDLMGHRISALPFSDHLPISTRSQYEALLDELNQRYPGVAQTIRTRLATTDVNTDRAAVKEAVLHRYRAGGKQHANFAWGVRKAQRLGVRVEPATTVAARERFLELYHQQRIHKFNSIPQPTSFFKAIHTCFMERGTGYYLEAFTAAGQHVSTLLVLTAQRGLYYKFGASNPNYLKTQANNLLLDHLTGQVDDGQYAFLDFGRSGTGAAYAGLRTFKERTGATAQPLSYLTTGPAFGNDALQRHLRNVTGELVEMAAPRSVVDPLSRHIYPFFA